MITARPRHSALHAGRPGPRCAAGSHDRVLLVAERDSGFQRQYLRRFAAALHRCDVITALTGDAAGPDGTEAAEAEAAVRYGDVLARARDAGAARVHVCFLADPRPLVAALDLERTDGPRVTASLFGLARCLRSPAHRRAAARLLAQPAVEALLVHSNDPRRCRADAHRLGLLASPKVRWLHDPVYDEPERYSLPRARARAALGLDPRAFLALALGRASRKKGFDLLLEAARRLSDVPGIAVILAGDLSAAPPGLLPAGPPPPNVMLVDRFLDDDDMSRYVAASDLVVLPYRRDYRHDTSGVLVQACLAHRPVLVPDLEPFRDLVAERRLGGTFRCEDADALARAIRRHAEVGPRPGGWAGYLAGIEGWDEIALRAGYPVSHQPRARGGPDERR